MLRHTLEVTTLLLGAALTMAVLAPGAVAQDDAKNRKSTDQLALTSIQVGSRYAYLADGQGYPVYTLVAGNPYSAEHLKTLPCKADCRAVWPPVTVPSADAEIKAMGVVDSSLIGTTKLENGAYQVTFNGYPLYYNRRDLDAPKGAGGELAGQAVEAFGGTWYILSATGGEPFNPFDR